MATIIRHQSADLLHQIQVATGWSQEHIARELDVSYQSVNRWMNGRIIPLRPYRAMIEALANRVEGRRDMKCMLKGIALVLVAVLMVSCATPMASHPIVMQGPGFDQGRYSYALYECRQMVEAQLRSDDQSDRAAGSALVGALLGAALGAAMGGAFGNAGLGATVGTVGGAAGGLSGYGQHVQARQQTYNQAVASCVAEHGYTVLGVGN